MRNSFPHSFDADAYIIIAFRKMRQFTLRFCALRGLRSKQIPHYAILRTVMIGV